jgi:hypothetical protein
MVNGVDARREIGLQNARRTRGRRGKVQRPGDVQVFTLKNNEKTEWLLDFAVVSEVQNKTWTHKNSTRKYVMDMERHKIDLYKESIDRTDAQFRCAPLQELGDQNLWNVSTQWQKK